jgi:hypothetical protein
MGGGRVRGLQLDHCSAIAGNWTDIESASTRWEFAQEPLEKSCYFGKHGL